MISAVIPLYNKAPYVARALESVLAQTVPAIEAIVVDDGSTDGGGDIAAGYAKRGVRLIRQENQGVSAARNRGIDEAQSDLIAFLDADDEWLPGFLATIARLTAVYPACGAYAQAVNLVATGGKRWTHVCDGIPAFPWEGLIPNYFRSAPTYPVCASAVAVPRYVFDDVGLFPVGVAHGEDIDMWTRIALKYRMCLSTQVGAVYHKEAENRTNALGQPQSEYCFVGVVREALKSGLVTPEQRQDAFEFIAHFQTEIASTNIRIGNPRYARQLLLSCRGTRKYARGWRRLMLQTLLPPGWPARLKAARHAMRNLAGCHE